MPLVPPATVAQPDVYSSGEGYMATTYMYPPSQSMTLSIEAISGITGSVSIACWLVVFTPQIIENFKRGSAEGLSLTFLVLWLLGDIFNVLGAILQGVIPTMLILAIYYTFADIVLLIQCLYYRAYNTKEIEEAPHTNGFHSASARPGTADSLPTEEAPLLSRTISDYVGHERRNSLLVFVEQAHHLSPANPLHDPPASPTGSVTKLYTNGIHTDGANGGSRNAVESLRHAQDAGHTSNGGYTNGTFEQNETRAKRSTGNGFWKGIARDAIAVSLVIFAGIAGWYLTPQHPAEEHDPHIPEHHPLEFSLLGQIFGYLCAVLYLGSRIPQIVLNYRRKSCEGVAFLFFLFACLGNITYVISILAYRPGKVEDGEGYWRYIGVNASWLLGSFGTLGLDFVIFIQFFMYQADNYELSDSAIMSEDDEATIRPEST